MPLAQLDPLDPPALLDRADLLAHRDPQDLVDLLESLEPLDQLGPQDPLARLERLDPVDPPDQWDLLELQEMWDPADLKDRLEPWVRLDRLVRSAPPVPLETRDQLVRVAQLELWVPLV